jgi:hypothetical protein
VTGFEPLMTAFFQGLSSPGLFRGSASYIAGGLPSQVAYFVAYKESKEWAQTYFGDSVPPVVLYACCGVFADLVGAYRVRRMRTWC